MAISPPAPFRDQAMTLRRHGTPEEVVFDLFYTPIYAETGKVDGVLCTVLENTEKVKAVQALARSREDLSRSNDRFRAAVDAGVEKVPKPKIKVKPKTKTKPGGELLETDL